jgi:UDP-GlcNAc:undecaprenyl-phosphate/decaprenyl-phosphate GlcNAc-1-phosphate transferase
MKAGLLVAIVAAILLWILKSLAYRLNWLDHPDERKAHAQAVPAVGGIAWLSALLIGAGVTGVLRTEPHLFVGLALIGLLGAIDDRKPLPSGLRLLVQMLATLVAFWDSAVLNNLGALFWPNTAISLSILAWPFTVFAAVGVINAANMSDGMDGLLGLLSLLVLGVLTALCYRQGFHLLPICAMALTALVPFLFVNVRTPWLKRASVFFGDAGSMSMGLLLAWLIVQCSQVQLPQAASSTLISPSLGLYLLAVPLIDTVSLMIRRLGNGTSPFKADQEHLHHFLQRAGFSVSQSLLILVSIACALQVIGLACQFAQVPEFVQVALFIAIALLAHWSLKRASRSGRWLGRTLRAELSA